MREKIFYVINLDKNRIGLLSLLLLGLLFSFFFLGVSVGRGNTKIAKSQMGTETQISDATNSSSENTDSTSSASEVDSKSLAEPSKQAENNNNDESTNSQLQGANGSDPVTFANKAPESSPQAIGSQVVDLQTTNTNSLIAKKKNSNTTANYPSENTQRQEALHKNSTKPIIPFSKKTPKKEISSPSVSSGVYTVQVAAFTDKTVADNFAKKINLENPKLKVKAYVKKRGRNYLVRFGADDNKDQLRKLISILKLDANIRKSAIIVKNS